MNLQKFMNDAWKVLKAAQIRPERFGSQHKMRDYDVEQSASRDLAHGREALFEMQSEPIRL